MARRYTVVFENVAVSAAQDLFQIKGASNKVLRIIGHNVHVVNTTAPTNQQFRFRSRFLPATVTDGSGGSTPAPQKTSPGDAAASFTALANNTTPATTSSTAVVLRNSGPNVFGGEEYMWPNPPEIPPSTSWTLELLSTPSGTVNMSGTVTVEELG